MYRVFSVYINTPLPRSISSSLPSYLKSATSSTLSPSILIPRPPNKSRSENASQIVTHPRHHPLPPLRPLHPRQPRRKTRQIRRHIYGTRLLERPRPLPPLRRASPSNRTPNRQPRRHVLPPAPQVPVVGERPCPDLRPKFLHSAKHARYEKVRGENHPKDY